MAVIFKLFNVHSLKKKGRFEKRVTKKVFYYLFSLFLFLCISCL